MKKYITLFLVFLIIGNSFSQNKTEELAVQRTIELLFAGMSKGDSAMVHSAFAEEVSMATISKDKNGQPNIRNESSISGFLKAVGTSHEFAFNEPIWNLKINIDGNLAQAWANYAFYLGKKFSHCGLDAFHLFKGADGKWRIFQLADTRQKEGCQIPKEVASKYSN
jgi:hypothetical protein